MMRRRKGFTLVEILLALPLILVVFALGAALIQTTLTLTTKSAASADAARQIDSAIFQMRNDVWSAGTVTADGKSANISHGPEKISWRIESENLIRQDSAGTRSWGAIGNDWNFAADPAGLIVRNSTTRGPQTMVLPSQLQIAQGGRP